LSKFCTSTAFQNKTWPERDRQETEGRVRIDKQSIIVPSCGLTPDSPNENRDSQYESNSPPHFLGTGPSKLLFSNNPTLA